MSLFESTLLNFICAMDMDNGQCAVDNYEKNTINNMSQTKVHTKGRRRVNLRTGKLKRIKTQVMSRHPWHSGKRAALE